MYTWLTKKTLQMVENERGKKAVENEELNKDFDEKEKDERYFNHVNKQIEVEESIEDIERKIDDAIANDESEEEIAELLKTKYEMQFRIIKQKEKIDAKEVENKIKKYFEEDKEPTRSGLCLALGIDYTTMVLWQNGYSNHEQFRQHMSDKELAEVMRNGVYKINAEMEKKIPAAVMTEIFKHEGIIGTNISKAQPPFDLGELDKYAH